HEGVFAMTLTNDKPVILITGSSGLLGDAIGQRLTGNFQLVGLDPVEPKTNEANVDWRACDLTRDADVRDALDRIRADYGSKIASVVHLAAYYDFSGEPSPLYDSLTVEGTRRLLTALRDFDVEQF